MNRKYDHETWSENNVEITDLDAPSHIVSPHGMSGILRMNLKRNVRWGLFAMTIMSLCVLFLLVLPNIADMRQTLFPHPVSPTETPVEATHQNTSWVVLSPAGSTLLFNMYDQQGTMIGDAYAIFTRNGTLAWKSTIKIKLVAQIIADIAYVIDQNDRVAALHMGTGRVLWRTNEAGSVNSVTSEIVVVQLYSSTFIVLDSRTGKEFWRYDGKVLENMYVWRTIICVISPANSTEGDANKKFLQAFDVRTGKKLWEKTLSPVLAIDTFVEQYIYVRHDDKNVSALNVENGQEAWRLSVPYIIQGNWLGYSTVAFIDPRSNTLSVIDPKSGKELWKREKASAISSIQFYPDIVLLTMVDGYVRVLNAQDGREIWFYYSSLSDSFVSYQDSTIYITRAHSQGVIAFDTAGQKKWEYQGSKDEYVALFNEQVLYIVNYQKKELYAIQTSDRKKLWTRPIKELGYPFSYS